MDNIIDFNIEKLLSGEYELIINDAIFEVLWWKYHYNNISPPILKVVLQYHGNSEYVYPIDLYAFNQKGNMLLGECKHPQVNRFLCLKLNKKTLEETLVPFDLQRAIAGDELITRCGYEVLEFHYFKHFFEPDLSRAVAIIKDGSLTILNRYDEKGKWYSRSEERSLDLFMKYPLASLPKPPSL